MLSSDVSRGLGLQRVGATPEVVGQLLERLGEESEDVRYAAAGALRRFGPSAATKEVVDALGRLAGAAESRGTRMEDAAFEALSELLTYYHPGGE